MKWSAIIFDLDGLMIDSEPIALQVWRELAAEHDREVSAELYQQVIGEEPIYGVRTIRSALEIPMGERELLEEYWGRRTRMMCQQVSLAPGLFELLERLKARSLKLAVASNSPCEYVEAVLSALGVRGFFLCVHSSEDVARGKPAPDVYLAAMECLGVEASDGLVLEDSPAGIAAAKAAGLTCYAVPNGDIPGADFSAADRVFDSLLAVASELESS